MRRLRYRLARWISPEFGALADACYFHLHGICDDLYDKRYTPDGPKQCCYQATYEYEDITGYGS